MLEQPSGIQVTDTHSGADGIEARVDDLGLAGIVHDLNNLLTPVIWMLDSLREKQAGTAVPCERIEGAMACAERARSLVCQLSDIQARRQTDSTIVRIPELLKELEKLFLCALGPRIKLVFDVAPAFPVIGIDRERIERALLNLIVNAREAMPNGGTMTVGAHTEFRSAAPLGRAEIGLHITISDTGTGMDTITLRRAAKPPFSTKPHGSGLGLAVTRDLIEQLNGDMAITSVLGIGTTIDVWLPAA